MDFSAEARRIFDKNWNVLQKKRADYGPKNITKTGLQGLATRLQDKVSRLTNLANSGESANYESVQDTLSDIANYGVIGEMVANGTWDKGGGTCYLAGPIDEVSAAEAADWRFTAAGMLAKRKWASFDPSRAFGQEVAHLHPEWLRNINRAAIMACDVVLARVPLEHRGFETLREIEFAKSRGKRVVVWTNSTSCGLFDLEHADNLPGCVGLVVQ
jgi:hypothetical protein